jgi:hypothetical protein
MAPFIDSLTPTLLQGFAALIFAHALADYVFQSGWMVHNKADPPVLMLHILIVFVLSNIALGGAWQVAGAVALAHLVIDAIKTWALPEPLRSSFLAYTGDQILHLLSIIIVLLYWPDAILLGVWGDLASVLFAPALLFAGLILCVIGGGYGVGLLTARFMEHIDDDSLPDAGRLIGQLERTLIFLLIWAGHPAGVGFLVAAKSILRFDSARDQKTGEYVIIGTLASFLWALAISYGTVSLLEIASNAP